MQGCHWQVWLPPVATVVRPGAVVAEQQQVAVRDVEVARRSSPPGDVRLGQELSIHPDLHGRDTHVVKAGPTFELFYGSDLLLPHRAAAWAVMEERMRVLAELGTRCKEVCSPLHLPTLTKITDSLVDLADQLAEAR